MVSCTQKNKKVMTHLQTPHVQLAASKKGHHLSVFQASGSKATQTATQPCQDLKFFNFTWLSSLASEAPQTSHS